MKNSLSLFYCSKCHKLLSHSALKIKESGQHVCFLCMKDLQESNDVDFEVNESVQEVSECLNVFKNSIFFSTTEKKRDENSLTKQGEDFSKIFRKFKIERLQNYLTERVRRLNDYEEGFIKHLEIVENQKRESDKMVELIQQRVIELRESKEIWNLVEEELGEKEWSELEFVERVENQIKKIEKKWKKREKEMRTKTKQMIERMKKNLLELDEKIGLSLREREIKNKELLEYLRKEYISLSRKLSKPKKNNNCFDLSFSLRNPTTYDDKHEIEDIRNEQLELIQLELTPISKIYQNIKILDLGFNLITYNEIEGISKSLKTNLFLTNLDLYNNLLESKGVKVLCHALNFNNTLKKLNLGSNKIDPEGAEYLSSFLKTNTSLKILILDDNKIGRTSFSLSQNKSLTELSIRYNYLGCYEVESIGDSLKSNNTLKILDLSNNIIGEKGAEIISSSLKINTSLTDLCLSYNNIKNNGMEYIIDSLKTNNSLKELSLDKNEIGVESICSLLSENNSLTKLDVDYNINDKGIDKIISVLETKKNILYFSSRYNYIPYSKITQIENILNRNKISI